MTVPEGVRCETCPFWAKYPDCKIGQCWVLVTVIDTAADERCGHHHPLWQEIARREAIEVLDKES